MSDSADAFFDWLLPEARDLQKKYHLDGWNISIRVVADTDLHPKNAAEVLIKEEYRVATIFLSESLAKSGHKDAILDAVDHEFQHIFLHPIDALKSLVLDAVPAQLQTVMLNEFGRTNERIRASLERLLSHTT